MPAPGRCYSARLPGFEVCHFARIVGVRGYFRYKSRTYRHIGRRRDDHPAMLFRTFAVDITLCPVMEDSLVTYTFWLMIFTGVLAASTIGLWIATSRSASIAEKAAKASAAIELPILLLSNIELNQQAIGANEPQWELPSRPCMIIVNYQNYGRTPATVIETSVDWVLGDSLPGSPQYKSAQAAMAGTIVRPNSSCRLTAGNYDITFTEDQRTRLTRGDLTLWVYGFVRCHDVLGGVHTFGFCGRWERGNDRLNSPHRFVDAGPLPYRYTTYALA